MIGKICELHARDRGFSAAFMSAFPKAMDFAADREHALSSVAGLAPRARDAGHLRSDFVLDDLILMLIANSGIRATSPAAAVAASRRFAAFAIQAFQASPEASPLPPVPRLAPVVLVSRRNATRQAKRVIEALSAPKAILPQRRPRAVPDQAEPPAAARP